MELKPCRRARLAVGSALSATISGLLALLLAGSTWAADPHRLFETRCGACHGHAGAFARETSAVVDGSVRGARGGADIAAFLPRHRGRGRCQPGGASLRGAARTLPS